MHIICIKNTIHNKWDYTCMLYEENGKVLDSIVFSYNNDTHFDNIIKQFS